MTAGDTRFVEVYESFFRLVYGYCLRRTSPDKVDDAVAETFLVAWRRIGDVPVGDAALPWLYGVAYRVLSTQWRARSRRGRLNSKLASVGITPVANALDYLVTAQESEQILEALSRLKRTDQEILRLAVWEELSHTEIAAVLDINTGAAKQRLSQARKNLGREFDRLENRTVRPPAAQKGGGSW